MSVLSLSGAIKERFDGAAALSFVDGKLTYGKSPTFDPDVTYYAVFWLVGETEMFTAGVPYCDMKWYQFDAYAPTWDGTELVMEAILSTFNPQIILTNPIIFRNGSVFNVLPGTSSQDMTEYVANNGDKLRRLHKDFRFYCNRTLSP